MAPLTIAMPQVPKKLDNLVVNSLTEYVILEHLLRPLVSYNSTGELTGDLLEKWEISGDFTEYIFKLKKNQYFSDGKLITSDEVVATFKRGIKYNNAVHYDFLKIKSIKKIDQLNFKIDFHKSEPFFLYDLEGPELRVLSLTDASKKLKEQDFTSSSGPYSFSKKVKNIELVSNTFYPSFPDRPKNIQFTDNKIEINNNSTQLKNIDLLWASSEISSEDNSILKNNNFKQKTPRLGFSFWLTLNPNGKIKELKSRKYLQKILQSKNLTSIKENIFLTQAREIYLKDGPGRLAKNTLHDLWDKIDKSDLPSKLPKKIHLLVQGSFPLKKSIISILRNSFKEVVVTEYRNFTDYANLIKNQAIYDIIQVNNDFSALDLRSTLNVTFNKNRPLIILNKDNHSISNSLASINKELDQSKRFLLSEKISRELLEQGLIVPLYYFNTIIYHKSNIDLSEWSSIVPDVGVWKLKQSMK